MVPSSEGRKGVDILDGKTFYITKSMLETYKICPWSFKRRYIDKIITPSTPAMEIGTRFHEFAERFFIHFDKLKSENWFKFIPTAFAPAEQDMARWFLQEEEYRFKKLSFEQWMPLKLEDKLRSHTQYLSGYIDRVDWRDIDERTVTIVEYKTGSSLNATSIRQQGAFYKLLWDEFYPDTTATHIKLINPKMMRVEEFEITTRTINSVNQHLEAMRDAISCNLFPRDCSMIKYGFCGLCNSKEVTL